jgi:hypothetical protein
MRRRARDSSRRSSPLPARAVHGAQALRRQRGLGRAVERDAAVGQQHHAPRLGNDLFDVVRDDQDGRALARERPTLSMNCWRATKSRPVVGLVEQQHLGLRDERTRNQHAAPLARRHLVERLGGQVQRVDPLQRVVPSSRIAGVTSW